MIITAQRVYVNKKMVKQIKKDIFSGCKGCLLVFVLVAIFVIADIFTPESTSNILWTIFFFIIGGHCLWNYSSCGRVHFQITGYGFIAVGIIALLQVLGIFAISFSTIWIIFIIVLVVGFGIEFIHKGKTGTCYRK